MKIRLIFFTLFIISGLLHAQAPQKFNYQAVARDGSGNLIANQNVSFRISLLQGSAIGTIVYQETHLKTTNAYGQANLIIGSGTVVTGTFSSISWGSNAYFIKTEMDAAGGNAFALMGTSQLLSVPYALYAKSAENGFSGNYSDLINKPILFDGQFSSLTGKPTTIAGYGITNAMSISHVANGILATNITNWNTAFAWGNHSGLYRPVSWVPAWTDITGKPALFDGSWTSLSGKPVFAAVATSGSYTDLSNKPSFFSGSYSDLTGKPILWDSTWASIKNKPVLFDGQFSSLTGKPTTITGYGITNAMSTSHAANGITASNITNWNNAFAWGNHSGLYLPVSWVPAWTDITGKPSLFDGSWTSLSGKPIFATVAYSGSYNDLNDKPIINASSNYTGITPISITSGSAPTISMAMSNATNDGYLSSTDWNTFNSKQTAITGNNFQTLMYNGGWMASSLIYNDGTNIGIGITMPSDVTHKLTVSGTTETFRLIGPGIYGSTAKLTFGDGNYVYLSEDSDDHLTISAASRTAIMGGNVGIGTTTPTQKLTVAGTIQSTVGGVQFPDNTIQTTAATSNAGTNTGDMQYWNGSAWVMIPVGTPGQILQLNASNIPAWTAVAYQEVNSLQAYTIGSNYVWSGGNILNGGSAITSRGVCWNSAPNPTIANNKTTNGTGAGLYQSYLIGLLGGTNYYARAYATTTIYGEQVNFTTLPAVIPLLTTTTASSILGTQAISGGNVTNNGGADITAKGVCWRTTTNPTIANSKTIDSMGTGMFVSSITGLFTNTTYYLRAYATNSAGTAYGNQISFTTLPNVVISDHYHGGIVAYVLQAGDPGYIAGQTHGIIAAPTDQSTSIQWYNGNVLATGASGTILGTGYANTNAIVAIQGAGNYAAKLCYDLIIDGYSGWYLPSKDELGKLYLSKSIIGIYHDGNHVIWESSSEAWTGVSWGVNFTDGLPGTYPTYQVGHVRAIKSF